MDAFHSKLHAPKPCVTKSLSVPVVVRYKAVYRPQKCVYLRYNQYFEWETSALYTPQVW